MTPPGVRAHPAGGPEGPLGYPHRGYPLDVLMTRRVMVITRVTYYKCKAPPRTYHYVTLRDKVHLAHLWAGDQPKHICGALARHYVP